MPTIDIRNPAIFIPLLVAFAWVVSLETRFQTFDRGSGSVAVAREEAIAAIAVQERRALTAITDRTAEVVSEIATHALGERVVVSSDDYHSPQMAATSGLVSVIAGSGVADYLIRIRAGSSGEEDDMGVVAVVYSQDDSAVAPIRAGEFWMIDSRQTSATVLWTPLIAPARATD